MDRHRLRAAVVAAVLLVAIPASAGQEAPVYVWSGTAPTGSCTGNRVVFVVGTGVGYCCQSSTWASCNAASGGSGSPGGLDTYVQFNDGGSFGGDAGFTYNKTTDTAVLTALSLTTLTCTGCVGSTQASALDTGDITTGTLPQARGGTGSGSLTCSAGQALTSNGTVQSCTSTITASDVVAASGVVSVSEINATGTPSASNFLRGDGTWNPATGSGAPTDAEYVVGALHAGLSAERLGTDTATVDVDFATVGQAKWNVLYAPALTCALCTTIGGQVSGTADPGVALVLRSADALSGVQTRDSPALRLRGAYWDTGVPESVPIDWTIFNDVTTTTPTSALTFQVDAVTKATLASDGNFTATTLTGNLECTACVGTTEVAALDAGDVTTGTFGQARGGTGAGALTCSAGQVLTSNGTVYSCTSAITADNLVAASGVVADAELASNYSGVGACGANTWASTLNDNAAPTCTQPAFSNLSGSATAAQLPALTAAALGAVKGTGTALVCTGTNKVTGFAADGTLQCATDQTGAGSTISAVEIDFSLTPEGAAGPSRFTAVKVVTDASVGPTSKVHAWQGGAAATGRQADENEMDAIVCRATPATGTFTLTCSCERSVTHGLFVVHYTVG